MKRRGGKREGTGWKKSPESTKITREINQKHWRRNHHNISLENRIFSTWQKVRAEGIFVSDFELHVMAAWFGAQTKTTFGTQSIISPTRTTSNRTLFSTGRESVLAMTWVWFLNLDSVEAVETIESRNKAYRSFRYEVVSLHCSSVDSLRFKIDTFCNI